MDTSWTQSWQENVPTTDRVYDSSWNALGDEPDLRQYATSGRRANTVYGGAADEYTARRSMR
jgi:hypothetical protein